MADKNIQMTQRNAGNTAWDNLYPKTKAANVNMADGTTVEAKANAHITDTTKHITAAERAAWNGKQAALGYTPINKAGDAMAGILMAQANTSYTVRQVHNMILSPNDADVNAMQNGDIWIKYV